MRRTLWAHSLRGHTWRTLRDSKSSSVQVFAALARRTKGGTERNRLKLIFHRRVLHHWHDLLFCCLFGALARHLAAERWYTKWWYTKRCHAVWTSLIWVGGFCSNFPILNPSSKINNVDLLWTGCFSRAVIAAGTCRCSFRRFLKASGGFFNRASYWAKFREGAESEQN